MIIPFRSEQEACKVDENDQLQSTESSLPSVDDSVDALTEIHRMWEIFALKSDSVLELRAISPFKKPIVRSIFRAQTYPSLDVLKTAFEEAALRLNRKGYNVYIVMNPIKRDFTGSSAKDSDIACRNLLLVDLDRQQTGNVPATEVELTIVRAMVDEILDFMAGLGMQEPVVVMSGNGYHLYYRLDGLPNTEATTQVISKVLRNLAAKFDNDFVHVDTSVSNASRITKIPGTFAYKGVASADRPYRKAVIV